VDDYWKKPDEIHKTQGPDERRAEGAGREPPEEPDPWRRVAEEPYVPSWRRSAEPEWAPPPASPRARPARTRDGEVSERSARLTISLLAASFAVLVIGVVVFFTVRTLRQGDDSPTVGPGGTTPEDAARALGGIGPAPGAELGPYAATRKAALARASGDRVAVVSLNQYSTEASARALVGGVEVLALLAAPPGGQPSVVTGDIGDWVSAQTADARAERDEIQKLIPTVRGDPEFQSFYRSEVDRLNKLISAIRADGDLVFGVVVRGPAPALRELGNTPEVRLVDVGPGADPGPKPAYRGIRPEETDKANEPNTRPF
jgi:hypothetical protein